MEKGERDWGNLPPELIAMVVRKVEQRAGARGEGRRLVAVAGVCRAWRRSVHGERKQSPLLTFPVAISHRGSNMECMLKKTGDTFRLVQRRDCGDEYFLLSARKKSTIRSSYFRISADPRLSRTQSHDEAVALVRSNLWRTSFTVAGPPMILSVHFEEAAVDGNCQRKMRCELGPRVRGDLKGEVGWRARLFGMLEWNKLTNPSYKSLKSRPGSSCPDVIKSRSMNERMTACSLKNKDPHWHERGQCWSLDYNGRASSIVASIHNFQLVSSDSIDGRVVLQLGKLSKGLFILDFGAPLSPVEAFAIALSSFATTVGLDI